MKALKIKQDAVQSTFDFILKNIDGKVESWGKLWAQSERATLVALQQEITALKMQSPFWQVWSMEKPSDFANRGKKQFSPEEVNRNFALVPQIENLIDKMNMATGRLQRMHAADQEELKP